MDSVLTPDGWGRVLRTQSAHGKTSYLVEGSGFKGWYDGLQVTADFADQPDDVVPNEDNKTTLPYPSRPQGPGWDGTTSTIPPDIDPHLEMGGNSDSLTGDPTGEDPVESDIEGLFEPSSHLAGVRPRRVHFASSDDPILNVSDIPEESPTGLDNSPINPDGVDTDDLFDGSLPHFEREASLYDRLVIKDDFSFMRFSSDDDDEKKNHHERGSGLSDSDSDDGGSEDSSSSDGSSSGDGGGGSHTAAIREALSITADLHFLANLCVCAEELPLHSKTEHRELVVEGGLKNRRKKNKPMGSKPLAGKHGDQNPKTPAEAGYHKTKGVDEVLRPATKGRKTRKVERPIQYAASDVDGVNPQPRDLDKLHKRYEQEQFTYQESNLPNLVDNSEDSGDNSDLLNHYASTRTAAPAQAPQPTQIESQIEQLMQFWAVDNNGWWHWTGSQSDLALLNQMQQQMMAVGAPSGPPGQMQTQSKTAAPAALAPLLEGAAAGEAAGAAGAAEGGAGAAAAQGGKGGIVNNLLGGGGGGLPKMPNPADALGGAANLLEGFNGGKDLGVAHHGVPFKSYSFAIEDNTPPRWREYLQTIASDKLVALAAWRDVVEKSKRLRAEGAIAVEVYKPEVITAYVQGDNGRYYTTVQRLGSIAPGVGRRLTSTQVSGWSCECEWGHWAWLRKRSFVGRMCSHAYALFSEMRSLDAKARKGKGKPLSAGKFASTAKTSWTREGSNFVWVTDDPTNPTAAIIRVGSSWGTKIWSDGLSEDSLSLGVFRHSEQARRAVARVVNAHMKLAGQGDVDVVGGGDDSGTFQPYAAPDSISGAGDNDPYSEDGAPEDLLSEERQQQGGGSTGIQEGTTRVGAFSVFSEAKDGNDDEGPETEEDGIEEEDDPDDEQSLDEEIAEDEDDSSDGQDDQGEESEPENDEAGDGGHYEDHKRDDDGDEGTDNPGDESDDNHVEKQSSVAELQRRYGLSYLAGANYSPSQQARLVNEGEGKTARNRGDLNLSGTHYETASGAAESPEDTLAFLF